MMVDDEELVLQNVSTGFRALHLTVCDHYRAVIFNTSVLFNTLTKLLNGEHEFQAVKQSPS
jgi:hypothetical protein